MGVIVLLIIGYGIWKLFNFIYGNHYDSIDDCDDSIERETENMYIMLKNVDDDFDLF